MTNRPFLKPEVTYQKSGSTFSKLEQYPLTLQISGKYAGALRRNRVRKIIIIIIREKESERKHKGPPLKTGDLNN